MVGKIARSGSLEHSFYYLCRMDLRLATTDDIPLIQVLADRIWRSHYLPILPPGQVDYMLEKFYSAKKIEEDMASGSKFWLPAVGGVPVGFIAIAPLAENGHYFIDKFYMDNGQRGLGLGSQSFGLLAFQYPDLVAWKLQVNRENYQSINFYFKVGFVIETILDKPIGNNFVMNDFVMIWRKPKPVTTPSYH